MSHERRIGRRQPLDVVEVTWVLPLLKGRRGRTVEAAGRISDISFFGAAIEGPAGLLQIRSVVQIRIQGGDPSVVRITRAAPAEDPRVTRYGVQFLEVAADLRELIDHAIAQGRP